MARAKKKTVGPSLEAGVRYKVIPPTKTALKKVREGFKGDASLLENMVFLSPLVFTGKDEAVSFLKERADSWSGKACPVLTIRDVESISHPKVLELKNRIERDRALLEEAKRKADVSNFKAKLIGCPRCESRINKLYIKASKCPVCDNALISPTSLMTIERRKERLKKDEQALAKELGRRAGDAPLKYLIALPKEGSKSNAK